MNFPANLIQKDELRNKSAIYQDRFAAARVLAKMLVPDMAEIRDGLILAIPAGGVPLGLGLHQEFKLDLDLIIIRKIQIPGNTEAGFGALAQTGDILLNQELLAELKLNPAQIETQIEKTRQELERKNRLFRQGREFPRVKGKSIILTDDGLASGFSMLAAVQMVKKHSPREIIVAVPTAPLRSIHKLSPEVEKIYSAHVQEFGSFAVANAYQHWSDLSESEVLQLLEDVF